MTFSNGVIKSLEKDLTTNSVLNRLIEEPTYKDAYRSVVEQGFGGGAEGDLSTLIDAELFKLDDFVREYSPSDEYSVFCLRKNDYFIAEASLRAKYIKGYSPILKRKGLIENLPEKIQIADKVVPKKLLAAYEEAERAFQKGVASGVSISTIFLSAYYAELLSVVKTKNLRDYLKNEIDCKNISSALRAKRKDEAKALFLQGGNISEEVVFSLVGADGEVGLSKFAFTPFFEMAKVAIEEKSANKPLVAFEALAESYPLLEAKKKKYKTEGATPFLLYYLYRKAEIRNVGIVLSGKKANMPTEEIKRRLRVGYDG